MDRYDGALLVVAAGILVLFVRDELRIAGVIGLPLDDGWIHLRFATNLATGGGFAINPGEPVAGSTAPLWTLCLAAGVALGVPGLVMAKVAGIAGYLATGFVTRRLGRALGLGPGLALAAGFGAVTLSRMAWGALSGMEVPLAAALVAMGALWAVRERPLLGAAAFSLATLARPEAGLLIPLHLASCRRWRDAVEGAVIAGLVLAPAIAFNLATVGRLVPATAAAKVEGGLVGRAEGLSGAWHVGGERVIAYLAEWGTRLFHDHAALPVLAALGLVVLFRERRPIRWLAAALVVHPVAVAVLAPFRGPAFQTGRYSSHLLPLALVVGATGLGAILTRVPARWARGAVVLFLLGGLVWPLGPASRAYAWGVQNINAMQVRLGRWIAQETPADALLAVNDIGAMSYFGNRRIIDLMGLATPAILPYRREGPEGILRYLEQTCPDYLVIFPEWFPALTARGDLFQPVQRVRLAHNEVAGAAEMVVYETAWRRGRPGATSCVPASRVGRPGRTLWRRLRARHPGTGT